jgi:hypothetical protein
MAIKANFRKYCAIQAEAVGDMFVEPRIGRRDQGQFIDDYMNFRIDPAECQDEAGQVCALFFSNVIVLTICSVTIMQVVPDPLRQPVQQPLREGVHR